MDNVLLHQNKAEVILLGTGGYGESILINLSNGKWIVVDSCTDINGNCLPLKYLRDNNVDIEKNVTLIICTHWHDDHIRGLSNLLKYCTNANFAFAIATDVVKFLQLIEFDYEKVEYNASASSTKEFHNCFKILYGRDKKPIYVSTDRLLYSEFVTTTNTQINLFSLSPSDATLHNFNFEISQLIDQYCITNRKIIYRGPNSKSVALLIEFGDSKIILGADLEVDYQNKDEGWLNVLDNSQSIKNKKAIIFKIPHHGSENGFDQRIWNELLMPNPVAKTTCYNKNMGLPTVDMIHNYQKLTDKLYFTSSTTNLKPKARSKEIEKLIQKLGIRLTEVKYSYGIVKSSCSLSEYPHNWIIECSGNAFKVE
jgi:beta-lactamase superfamily II metal-dependent hydrolase